MRIAWLEIENFRSIKKLRIDGLDKPQVVIEGPNDVGKSNILQALDLFFSALPTLLRDRAVIKASIPGEPPLQPEWLSDWSGIFRHGEDKIQVSVGIRFSEDDGARGWVPSEGEVVKYTIQWMLNSNNSVGWALLDSDTPMNFVGPMAWALAPAFRLVATKRYLGTEDLRLNGSVPWEDYARWKGSNLKRMLFVYKNSPDLEIQERFERLRSAVQDKDLGIGTVNVSVSPSERIGVRTRQNGVEMDLEQRGSGIQQLLTLLALAVCHRGKILAVEEPEMNLSEPNQRLLWKKLREFTGSEGPMDQVFVTSHSRVFEEEAERLIVSRDPELGTQARWAEPVPEKRQAEDEVLHVSRGGSVTLPPDMLKQLGIQEEKNVYLVPTKHGYQLLGPQGYADHLMEDGSDAESDG